MATVRRVESRRFPAAAEEDNTRVALRVSARSCSSIRETPRGSRTGVERRASVESEYLKSKPPALAFRNGPTIGWMELQRASRLFHSRSPTYQSPSAAR